MSSLLTLSPREVHIWYTLPPLLNDFLLIQSYHAMMSDAETTQYHRFHFERHRHQHLVTRALVRTTLSRYVVGTPQSWNFISNSYGKPEVVLPKNSSKIRFNLSHTDGVVACAVTLDDDIGVDVESLDRAVSVQSLAQRFFSLKESQALLRLPLEEQSQRFFDYWTLKEAYVKAKGQGISLPLDQFSFHLPPEPLSASFDPRLDESLSNWTFFSFSPFSRYQSAIAVKKPFELGVEFSLRKVIPGENSWSVLRQDPIHQTQLLMIL